MRCKILLFGANSYIGQNLARQIDGPDVLLSGRKYPVYHHNSPWLSADMVETPERFEAVRPRELWIVARPLDQDIPMNLEFYRNLKNLIYVYTQRLHLKRVVFLSSQLVYPTPDTADPITSQTPTLPSEHYEYTKLDMELFLTMLHMTGRLTSVDIIRIPLAIGGKINPKQHDDQPFYFWTGQYAQGQGWEEIPEDDWAYGASALNLTDFAASLATQPWKEGVRTRNASSGHVRYAELDRMCRDVFGPSEPGPEMWRPRSTFFLLDEMGLPQHDSPEIVQLLIDHWKKVATR